MSRNLIESFCKASLRRPSGIQMVPHCPVCDYDTAGLPGAVCPECGSDMSRLKPGRGLRAHVAISGALLAVCVLAGIRVAFILADVYQFDDIWYWQADQLMVLGPLMGISGILAFLLARRPGLLARCPDFWCTLLFAAVIIGGPLLVISQCSDIRI